MSTSSVSSSSSSPNISDNDINRDIVMNSKKLKAELAKELEKERKAAAAKGKPTCNDGSGLKIGNDGRVTSGRIVRLQKIIKARQVLKTQTLKRMRKYFRRMYLRQAYNNVRRAVPPQNTFNDRGSNNVEQSKRTVFISKDAKRMWVTVEFLSS